MTRARLLLGLAAIAGGACRSSPPPAPTAVAVEDTEQRRTALTALSRTGWVASASSSGGTTPASNAIDGSTTTRWRANAAQATNQWFQVDMVSARTFMELRLDTSGAATEYPRNFKVQAANDNVSWGTAPTIATGAGTSAVTTIVFAPQTARYVRVTLTGSSTSFWSIYDLQVYGTALSRSGWTATASSTNGSNVAGNALDGSTTTRWSSAGAQTGQWFKVDMKSPRTFNRLILDAGTTTNNFPRGYAVFVSNDDVNWGTAVATGTGTTAFIVVTFTTQHARYIRIDQTATNSTTWSIQELNVEGQPTIQIAQPRLGWIPTASPNTAGNVPANALDGSTSTRWTSSTAQTTGMFFQVDMLTARIFDQITLDAGTSTNNFPRAFEVRVSNDASAWTTVTTGTGTAAMVTITFAARTARHIQVRLTGANSNPWSIQEMNVTGPALSRPGWVATGSSTNGTNVAGNALDASTSTRWSTMGAQTGQSFTVDMGTAQVFNQITLDAGSTTSNNFPRAYSVSVSNDGSSWGSPVASGTGTTRLVTINLPLQTGRFFRINQTATSSTTWSIEELNVWRIAGLCDTVTCTASDQCHDVGVCDSGTGVCSNPNKANGTMCSDGSACTTGETCQSGACTGGTAVTCTTDECHTIGACVPATGCPMPVNKANGTMCNDGNACTQTSTCQAGICTGANPVVCTALDQCRDVGTCNPGTGACSNPNKTDGTGCNDGSACTQTDSCQAGVCTGANPVACTASDQCHDVGICAPATGVCSNPNKLDGSGCTDGNACTQTDTCQAGACTGANPLVCAASDQCHVAGTCDPATGTCPNPPAADPNGPIITPLAATATSELPPLNGGLGRPAIASIDESGLASPTPAQFSGIAGLPKHNEASETPSPVLWMSYYVVPTPQAPVSITYDLGSARSVSALIVWNYAEVYAVSPTSAGIALTGRSAKDVKVYASTSDPNPQTFVQTFRFAKANPSPQGFSSNVAPPADNQLDYNTAPDIYYLNASVTARYVRFEILSNYGDGVGVGLSEVRFGDITRTTCSDGNACTQTDTCEAGSCSGSNSVVCADPDQCHGVSTCDTGTGVCSSAEKPNGTACDDGNGCTEFDVCQAGVCQGPTTITCYPQSQCQDYGTCIPNPPPAGPPSTQDLIGWWKLDGDGQDSSGNGHHLTVVEGNAVAGPGREGLGMTFDGTACLTTPDVWADSRMQGAPGVTLMAWVRGANAFTCPSEPRAIMGKGWDYTTAAWCLTPGSPGTTGWVTYPGTSAFPYPSGWGQLFPDRWVLYTMTWDQHYVRNYINGQFGNAYLNEDPGIVDAGLFAIGCQVRSAGTGVRTNHFMGSIDEAMLYGRALSDAEIAAYFNASYPCTQPTKPNGSTCTDGNGCSVADTCQSGACVSGAPMVCTADQCNDAGTCNPATGTCSTNAKVDGTVCTDGNACTRTDTCQTGTCVGANPVVCVAEDTCHTAGICDPGTGVCTNPPAPGGACQLGAFDYDKAGRLIRDRGAQLAYDAYDQLKTVAPIPGGTPALGPARIDRVGNLPSISTSVQGVNQQGHVTGYVWTAAGPTRAFLWRSGQDIDLHAVAGLTGWSLGRGINDLGTVAGFNLDVSGLHHAFRYNPATGYEDLGNPGFRVQVTNINNLNQMTGVEDTPTGHGWRYTDGVGYEDIGTLPGGSRSYGWTVDPFGNVFGSAAVAETPPSGTPGFAQFGHAVLFNDVIGLQDLNSYVDPMSGLTLILANSSDGEWVVGTGSIGGRDVGYRLRLSTGVVEQFDDWPGNIRGSGINSYGEAVGHGFQAVGSMQAAWLYTDQLGFVNLNTLIDPASGWELRSAWAINDAGDVTGQGLLNGMPAGFVLHLPLRGSSGGAPMVAEAHTYGYDGLRTSTTTAPGMGSAAVQFWFTQDYSQHNGKREHYVRIGDRIVAKVTLQPPMGGMGPTTVQHKPVITGGREWVRLTFAALLMLAALMGIAIGVVKRRRRWIPAVAGIAAVLIGAASCETYSRSGGALAWDLLANLTRYFHTGISVGPTLITDNLGALVEERRYEPFGQPIPTVNVVAEPQNILGKLTNPNTGWSYHGARWMMPQTARWTAPDPAVKGPSEEKLKRPWDLNPYTYVRQSPTLFWDADGNDVYMIVFTNKPSDDVFRLAAATRMREIQRSPSFDPQKDQVYMSGVLDLGNLKGQVDAWVKDANVKGYGFTVGFDHFGHSANDGPRGDVPASRSALDPGSRQLTANAWGSIDFNWDPAKSLAAFHGCNSLYFAKTFKLQQPGVQWVAGFDSWSFPSTSQRYRLLPDELKMNEDIYFIGGTTWSMGRYLQGKSGAPQWAKPMTVTNGTDSFTTYSNPNPPAPAASSNSWRE